MDNDGRFYCLEFTNGIGVPHQVVFQIREDGTLRKRVDNGPGQGIERVYEVDFDQVRTAIDGGAVYQMDLGRGVSGEEA